MYSKGHGPNEHNAAETNSDTCMSKNSLHVPAVKSQNILGTFNPQEIKERCSVKDAQRYTFVIIFNEKSLIGPKSLLNNRLKTANN
jgi:hypothetical protein